MAGRQIWVYALLSGPEQRNVLGMESQHGSRELNLQGDGKYVAEGFRATVINRLINAGINLDALEALGSRFLSRPN